MAVLASTARNSIGAGYWYAMPALAGPANGRISTSRNLSPGTTR
jgi:hypothetical protein